MVKSINKRIILGFVIVLNLLLCANVHAESETHTYSIPVSGAIGWTSNNNNSIDLTQYLTQRFSFGNVIYVGNSQGAGTWNEFCGIYNLSNIKSGYYDISVGSYFKGTTGSQNLLVSINNSSYNSNFTYLNFNGISGTNSSNPVIGSIGASKSNVYLSNGYYRVCYRFLDSVSLSGAYGFSYLSLNSSSNNSFVSEQQKTTSAIDKNTKAQEKTNDTIKDDKTDDPSSDISSMNGKLASNGSISQLLTLPITLYQSILNSLNGSCSPISLGTLYNYNLNFPCINLQDLLGSTLYNIIDILCCGLFILSFRKKMVDIFNHMTSLNDRGNELE